MPPHARPDPLRLAALIIELRRTLRRGVEPGGEPPARTPAEQELMRYVATHPGVGTTAISRALRLRANTVSGLCGGLVRDGLLLRESDPADGRVARFFISDSAAVDRERKMERRSGRLSTALRRLDPDQRAVIAAAVPALEALVEVLDEPGPG